MREIGKSQKKSNYLVKIFGLSILLFILTVAVIKFLNLERFVVRGPKTVIQLITDTGLKSDNGRVNVLLLGIGGTGHEGPNLADTIILASIDKGGRDVALVSIPRDLWAPSFSAKINSAYAYGQGKDQGLELAKKTVSLLFGIPVHYAVRVDFDGFIKAVDLADGLDVNVEVPFTDSKYPLFGREDDTCGLAVETDFENGMMVTVVRDATGSAMVVTEENNPFTCRYETISFARGLTHMDGATALKFVRSRHGTNDEGSDFARSARQHKIILAFRSQVLSTQTLINPKTIIDLISTFGQSIDTDVTSENVPHFAKLGQKIDPVSIRRIVLDSGRDESVLDIGNPADYGGQFVLVPKIGGWQELAEYVQGEIFKLE